MRKILTSLTLALALSVAATPKKSEAGLLIGYLAGSPGTGAAIGGGVGAGLLTVGLVFEDFHPFADPITAGLFVFGFGGAAVAVTLLDVDGSLNSDGLVQSFRDRYPNVDNREALVSLAEATNIEWKERTKARPEMTQVKISLSQSRLEEIFSSSDVLDEDFQQIVRDFQ